MMVIRVVGIVAFLLLVYITIMLYHKKKINLAECLVWCGVWAVTAFTAAFSNLLMPLMDILKIVRVFDFLFMVSISALLLLTFFTRIELRKTQEKLDDLIEHYALESEIISNQLPPK